MIRSDQDAQKWVMRREDRDVKEVNGVRMTVAVKRILAQKSG